MLPTSLYISHRVCLLSQKRLQARNNNVLLTQVPEKLGSLLFRFVGSEIFRQNTLLAKTFYISRSIYTKYNFVLGIQPTNTAQCPNKHLNLTSGQNSNVEKESGSPRPQYVKQSGRMELVGNETLTSVLQVSQSQL